MKALETIDAVVRSRWYVQSYFSANPTIDSMIKFAQKWSFDSCVRLITHFTGTKNAEATFTDPRDTYMKALRTIDAVVRSRWCVPSHFL